MIRFSKTTGGFYDSKLSYPNLPDDVVDVTDAEHAALMAEQVGGKMISFDRNGRPVSADRPALDVSVVREATNVTRGDFCLALMDNGVLSVDDAVTAAQGIWPAALDAFLVGLSDSDAARYKITWSSAVTIRRMHPLIVALQGHLSLESAQVDALFGI